jgi:hypothetical protein
MPKESIYDNDRKYTNPAMDTMAMSQQAHAAFPYNLYF